MRRILSTLLVAGLVFLGSVSARAQGQVELRGVVRDAASAKALIGALVTLDVGPFARTTRTDETGAFTFAGVRPGEHLLNVKWLGYEERSSSIDVKDGAAPLQIALTRVQALDTIRVRAARQAIYGVVGAGPTLTPIKGAAVQIIGKTQKTFTDANGRFFVEIRTPGPYVVRATAKDHGPQTVSVTVPPDGGVEVAMLLDTTSGNTRALDAAYAEFTERLARRRKTSALLTRAELQRDTTKTQLFQAAQSSSGFASAGLTWGDTVCIFVDGRPRPAASIHLFDAADVEAVELYTKGEASGTLVLRWPRGMPCTDTGRRSMGSKQIYVTPGRFMSSRVTKDQIYWVVIWLKH